MLDDPRQYTLFRIQENITHYVVFLVRHQPFSMSYFNECSQLQKMSKIVYLYVKSLFLQYSFMNCSSDQFCVCQLPISLLPILIMCEVITPHVISIWNIYKFRFMIFNSFNHLLIGYTWSTWVNDKLLQKDISEEYWVVK